MDGVLLHFQRAVVCFEALVGADAPVIVDAIIGVQVDQVAVFKVRMILQETVADGEFQIPAGLESYAAVDLGEGVVPAADWQLGVDAEAHPLKRLEADFVI